VGMKTYPTLRPDYSTIARDNGLPLSVARAVTAMGRRALYQREATTDDAVANDIIRKGAVAPATTATTSALKQTSISTLAAVMGPTSAIGQLIPRCLNVALDGVSVAIPSVTADPTAVGWVAEGGPLPVKQFSFGAGVTLTTKKLGMITVLTREVFEYTEAESIIRELLARNLSLSFEKYFFGTDAVSASQPAGLLKDITPTGATAGGTDLSMITDLANIGASVAKISSDLFYVAGPAAGVKISLRAPFFKYPLAISSALDDDTVVCLSPSCVAIAGGLDPPRLNVAREAVLHMDTAPTQLSGNATATPVAAAYPLRSLFQSDAIAIRLRADVDFALRDAGGIAFVANVTW
jgi:Phage capsid family